MPSLKEVRSRITSVGSTMQITSAMKMVSAAKLRRAQDAISQMRPYATKLKEILANASASADSTDTPYTRKTENIRKVLILVITSNRGLCGAFNTQVIRQVNNLVKTRYSGAEASVLTIGKKGGDFYKKSDLRIMGSSMPRRLNELFDDLSFGNTAPVAEVIMESFVKKEFDEVVMVYNQFKNAAVQFVTTEQLLPLAADSSEEVNDVDYIFEPSKEFIVEELIPKSIKIQFHKALLDSLAAEHGARMTAMHKATDNARDLLKELKLTYNKARQAAITKEILEIVGGAEALKSS